MMELDKEGYLKIGGKNSWLIKAHTKTYGYTSVGKNMLIVDKDLIGKIVKFKIEFIDDLNKYDVEYLLKAAKEQIAFTDKQIDEDTVKIGVEAPKGQNKDL